MAPSRGSRAGDFERWRNQQLREQQRAQKAAEAATKAAQRDERVRSVAASKRDAEEGTASLQRSIERLEGLLTTGLQTPAAIDLSGLFRRSREIPFEPGELGRPAPRPTWQTFEPTAPGLIAGLMGGRAKYDARVVAARQQYDRAEAEWITAEKVRSAALALAREEHQRLVARDREACQAFNQRIQALIDGLVARPMGLAV